MPTPPVKGITCPACRGVLLHVYRVYRPAPGVMVRYRVCTVCLTRVATEERITSRRKPTGPKRPA